ncbi:hypothetical protein C1Y63_04935 [Corynebacterium sp. 13CS0277]|uniref:hypothetical protein n=1 Tax=Corynebacterium sp. 13CS0277 TaxID=2071994 RepID=UPI000D030272|nr:hypothetical protein [Corynebacterium sp. 13CS0277]PRQ11757.1 hypothetical protein C1Y63_04935 [Corynebacterium sp. 13CS0277]
MTTSHRAPEPTTPADDTSRAEVTFIATALAFLVIGAALLLIAQIAMLIAGPGVASILTGCFVAATLLALLATHPIVTNRFAADDHH